MKQNLLGLHVDSAKKEIIKCCLVLVRPAGLGHLPGSQELPEEVTSIS